MLIIYILSLIVVLLTGFAGIKAVRDEQGYLDLVDLGLLVPIPLALGFTPGLNTIIASICLIYWVGVLIHFKFPKTRFFEKKD